MTRPVLPVDPGELAAMVERLWPAAARKHEVDPEWYKMGTFDGRLESWATHSGVPGYTSAVEALVAALEDAGLEVEGIGHERCVLGWAAWSTWTTARQPYLVPLRVLDPCHAAVVGRDERLRRERAVQAGGGR